MNTILLHNGLGCIDIAKMMITYNGIKNQKENGRKVPELCRSDSGYSRVLLPFEGRKKHVARPLSPSIARKRKMYPKIEAKWRDLSVRRGF